MHYTEEIFNRIRHLVKRHSKDIQNELLLNTSWYNNFKQRVLHIAMGNQS